MMVTKCKRNTDTKNSSERVMILTVGIDSGHGSGNSESIGIGTGNELVPIPTPHLPSSLTAASFTNATTKSCMMALPESKNRKVAAIVRRSERASKPHVKKTCRSIKHTVRDPLSQSINPMKKSLKKDSFDAEHFSPLCVKKKMRRRTQMNNNTPDITHRHCINLVINNTAATAKEKVICNNNNHDYAFLPTVISKSESSKIVLNAEGTVENANSGSVSVHQDEGSLNLNSASVVEEENGLHNHLKAHESILFEESPDFWDRFLLDTYHHIVSNTTGLTDFDPIPYQVLARGIPVAPEKSHHCYNGSSSTSLPSAIVESSSGKGADLSSTMNEKFSQTDKANMSYAVNGKSCTQLNHSQSHCNVKVGNACEDEHSKDPINTVGHESWQMDVINRMLFYLDTETNCPHSMYGLQFHSIVERCSKLHLQGIFKYRHLPGAIFEQMVNTVGGSIFLSIYKAAKRLSYGRLSSDAGVGAVARSNAQCVPPNLTQLAVGFGYCMARSISFKGRKICPDLINTQSIQYTAEIGAQTVLNMSEETRLSFWKECILKDGVEK